MGFWAALTPTGGAVSLDEGGLELGLVSQENSESS